MRHYVVFRPPQNGIRDCMNDGSASVRAQATPTFQAAKHPGGEPPGCQVANQAAWACSAGAWIAAIMSAAVFWMRSREAASVSVLPSKSWM